MASTYSDKLRIELISAGDQSGTWGDTTNANLGTLIEESIAGVASVAMGDANQTLTANNGVTDEARKMVLKLTGTLTATRQVIVPSKEKIYVVHNAATGGKVHVKTSGATGVEVSPGFKTILYCDGTTVISVIPQALNETTTTNDVLTYNGTTWAASNAGGLVFSTGMIMMWAGTIATIPTGWVLCNGSSGSPDLRDKFIIGASQDDSGVAKTNVTGSLTQSGGSKDAIVVEHNHTATFTGSSHYHNTFRGERASSNELWTNPSGPFNFNHATAQKVLGQDRDYVIGGTNSTPNGGRTSSVTATGTVSVANQGSSGTDANLPPYYALAYIYKT